MTASQQVIAMTHGYAAHRAVMVPLATRLRKFGYRVVNWGYASVCKDITEHARAFRRLLEELDADPQTGDLFIVAHSMGSILTRVALQDAPLPKLKRIVMLCPPNRGSNIAGISAPLVGWVSKPLREISDRSDSFVNRLPADIQGDCEVGIVQASVDFVVPKANTFLPGAKDYIQLSGLHSSVLFRNTTAEVVHAFLQHGKFPVPT